jgi:hypothetical protein
MACWPLGPRRKPDSVERAAWRAVAGNAAFAALSLACVGWYAYSDRWLLAAFNLLCSAGNVYMVRVNYRTAWNARLGRIQEK